MASRYRPMQFEYKMTKNEICQLNLAINKIRDLMEKNKCHS